MGSLISLGRLTDWKRLTALCRGIMRLFFIQVAWIVCCHMLEKIWPKKKHAIAYAKTFVLYAQSTKCWVLSAYIYSR